MGDQSQWKQFVQLYGEKNPYLTRKQVLQQAKKPFQQLKQYYQKGGKQIKITITIIGTQKEVEYKLNVDDDDTFWYVVYQNKIKNPDDNKKFINVEDYNIYINDTNTNIETGDLYISLANLGVKDSANIILRKK
jgi:hypothetical protein